MEEKTVAIKSLPVETREFPRSDITKWREIRK
jgi:hypothetical protein